MGRDDPESFEYCQNGFAVTALCGNADWYQSQNNRPHQVWLTVSQDPTNLLNLKLLKC